MKLVHTVRLSLAWALARAADILAGDLLDEPIVEQAPEPEPPTESVLPIAEPNERAREMLRAGRQQAAPSIKVEPQPLRGSLQARSARGSASRWR